MRDHYVFSKDLTEPNAPFRIDLELEASELQAIGHVSAQWAFLEFHIKAHSEFLASSLDETLPKDAKNESFRRRMKTWADLTGRALSNAPDHLARVEALIQRVGSMQQERHNLMHGLIQWDEKDPDRLKVFARRNPHNAPWKVDTQRIEAVALKIAALNADLLTVHNECPGLPLENIVPGKTRRLGKTVHVESPPEELERFDAFLEAIGRRPTKGGRFS